MPGASVILNSVVALVDRFPVLAGVDLEIAAGEVVVLEGSNGAGKTSLFRLLSGLLPVTSGSAFVFGHDLVSDRKAVRQVVGFMAHEPFLYDDLTVRENVEFFAGLSKGDQSRVELALRRFDLKGRLESTIACRLSQGQRRRAGLCVLLARNPQLWLLDEPHAGLDAGARAELDLIVEDVAAHGGTVIYSSHESHRSNLVNHRRVRIEGGQVLDGKTVSVSEYVS